MKKKLFLTAIIFVMVIGACGCMLKKTDVKAEMLQYMKDKYDEDFTFIEYADVGGLFPKSSACFVESQNYPGEKIHVGKTCTDEKANTYIFQDDYVAIIYRQQATEEINAAVSDAFGDRAQAQYKSSYEFLSSSLDKTSTLQEFMSNTDVAALDLHIWVDSTIPYDPDEDVASLIQALKTHRIYGYIHVFYVGDPSILAQAADPNLEDQLIYDDQYIHVGIVTMTNDLELKSIRWENGALADE